MKAFVCNSYSNAVGVCVHQLDANDGTSALMVFSVTWGMCVFRAAETAVDPWTHNMRPTGVALMGSSSLQRDMLLKSTSTGN